MKISEIKEDVEKMLLAKYGNVEVKSIETISSGDFEAKGDKMRNFQQQYFMRNQDALALIACCQRNRLTATFRAAGKNTITRIQQGSPCKGHTIMSKSIKQISADKWTYDADAGVSLSEYAGFVGYSDMSSKKLIGLYSFNSKLLLPEVVKISDVKSDSDKLKLCYTGDYDLHDLLYKGDRLIATTPVEHSTIDLLNWAMLSSDPARKKFVCDNEKNNKTDTGSQPDTYRTYHSPYALIRHGAQTSFVDYLLSNEAKDEIKKIVPYDIDKISDTLYMSDSVVKIDSMVAAFHSDGQIYLLDTIGKVYCFYNKVLDTKTIPFYYFFNDLMQKPFPKIGQSESQIIAKIKAYSEYINSILCKHVRLIK